MSNMKRKLNDKEIEDILSVVPLNRALPEIIAFKVRKNIVDSLKEDILKIELVESAIPEFKKEIERQFYKTNIQAGESVGIITAQSIGERQTQSTLNSVDWTEKVLYMKDSEVKIEPIGKMIDELLSKNSKNIIHYEENKTEYLNLDNGYFIPSCDENGMISWQKIEAVTRHLPNGKLVKVTTESGRVVTASKSKSFITWNGSNFIPTLGSEIKLSDVIPCSKLLIRNFCDDEFNNYIYEQNKRSIKLDSDFGNLVGCAISNKVIFDPESYSLVVMNTVPYNIRKNILIWALKNKFSVTYKNKSQDKWDLCIYSSFLVKFFLEKFTLYEKDKILPEFVFTSPKEFIFGLIKAYLKNNKIKKNKYYKCTSLDLCHSLSILFSFFNIFIKIREDKNGSYILEINKKPDEVSPDEGSPDEGYPRDRDVYFDRLIKIEEVDSTNGFVYDFTVENTRTFNMFNGLCMYDTFHSAGMSVKTVITGVPRFSELLNATKEPKAQSCFVYFEKKFTDLKEMRNILKHNLIELNLNRLSKNISIHIDQKSDDYWYDFYTILYGDEYESFDSYIRFEIDNSILYEYSLTLCEICKTLEKLYGDIKCVFSPDSLGIIDLYLNTGDITQNKEYFTLEECKISYIEDDILPNITKEKLTGISGILEVYPEKKDDEWIVETEGSNLKEILGLDITDQTRTISNNMWEIYDTLGIEAARNFLIEEFSAVVSSDGTYVNDSHIKLLVDIMTYTGSITSISRYGMKKETCGPLAKASFEESLDNFMKAGAYGEVENIKGVSASVMLGKIPQIGSGLCDILIDIDRLPNEKEILDKKVYEKDDHLDNSLEEELKRMKIDCVINTKEKLHKKTQEKEKPTKKNNKKPNMFVF